MPLRDYQNGQIRQTATGQKLRLQITLVAALVVGLLSLGSWLYWKSEAAFTPTDPLTLCPTNQPPSRVVVLLLDVSDEFTEAQRIAVANLLERVRSGVPRYGLVEVYTVDRLDRRLTEPVLHLCNPGDGADLKRLYQNPDLARKRWLGFSSKLTTEINREMHGAGLTGSPIFEAIQAVALRTFGAVKYDNVPKRLVVISDLLQHVPGKMSMYSAIPAFEEFASSPYFSQVRASLDQVSVEVYYLARPSVATQGRAHIAFWEDYFSAQGATVESVEKVFGSQ